MTDTIYILYYVYPTHTVQERISFLTEDDAKKRGEAYVSKAERWDGRKLTFKIVPYTLKYEKV